MKDGKKPWDSVLFWIPVAIALYTAVFLVMLYGALYDKDSLLYQIFHPIFSPKWVRPF